MVQILEGNNNSFMQSILGGLAEGIPGAIEQYQQQRKMAQQMQQENDAAQRLGIDLSGIGSPELRKSLITDALQGKRDENKSNLDYVRMQQLQNEKYAFEKELASQNQENQARMNDARINAKKEEKREKKEEDNRALRGGLDTLKRMKEIRRRGRLGIGSEYSLFAKTRQAAGEYSQLGKSLIQLSAGGLIIKNQKEFETYAHDLFDPTITDSKAQGVLNAIERIIRNNMGENQERGKKTFRPPFSSYIGAK